MNAFEWTDATTVEEALAAVAGAPGAAAVKAGGIDLIDLLKDGLAAPRRLVNIRKVKALGGIGSDETGLRVGPLATLAEIAADRAVRRNYTALADAAGHAATPQIRNMATAGGNLLQRPRCWYFRSEHFPCLRKGGDLCYAHAGENQYHAIFGNARCAIVHPSAAAVALVALGARLELASAAGRREVALEEFFVAPERDVTRENALGQGELITEIRVPASGMRSAYLKQGEKESFDWPIAEVAVALDMDGGRVRRASVVLGAAAPVPYRARAAEAALVGRTLDEDAARHAAKAALEGATPLTQNGYKVPVFQAIVRRTILAAGGTR
jgi:xanthine dehydrogenase YagS FAD-binding subunit